MPAAMMLFMCDTSARTILLRLHTLMDTCKLSFSSSGVSPSFRLTLRIIPVTSASVRNFASIGPSW